MVARILLALLLLTGAAHAQQGFNNSQTVQCGNLPAQTGDVVTSGCAATIQPGAVTSAKMAAGAVGSGLGLQRVLCSVRSANMNVTTDQACTLPTAVTAWAMTAVWMTNCSSTLVGGLAAGGVYTAASKGGTALVAAVQVYTGLTAATVILPLTIATGLTTRQTGAAVFFSLTTGNGSAITCDFYVLGNDLT